MDGDQRPIRFGGGQLPRFGQNDARTIGRPMPDGFVPCEPKWSKAEHCNPPAGEATPAARLVNVSRMALAARLKHGVPLSEMLGHFQSLCLLEEQLISHRI